MVMATSVIEIVIGPIEIMKIDQKGVTYNCNMLALFSRNIVDYCPSLVVTVSFLEENIMDFG